MESRVRKRGSVDRQDGEPDMTLRRGSEHSRVMCRGGGMSRIIRSATKAILEDVGQCVTARRVWSGSDPFSG